MEKPFVSLLDDLDSNEKNFLEKYPSVAILIEPFRGDWKGTSPLLGEGSDRTRNLESALFDLSKAAKVVNDEAYVMWPLGPGSCPAGLTLTLGRARGSDLLFSESSVSKVHASLTRADCSWLLEDLGSRNGTYVAGIKLTPGLPHALSEGDSFRLGEGVVVRLFEPGALWAFCKALQPMAEE